MNHQHAEHNILNRIISFFTAFTFIFTSTVGAAPILPQPEFTAPIRISVPPIRIPSEFAHVEKVVGDFSDKHPSFIYIQDAHSNYDAQLSMKALLKHLKENEGIDLVLVEGAASNLDSKRLKFFEEDKINRDIADKLAQKGNINGLELFLLESDDSVKALGVEDPVLYADNLKAFRRVIKVRPKTESFLNGVRAELDRLSNHLLNRELRSFVHLFESYRTDTLDLKHFLTELKNQAKTTLDINLEDPVSQIEYPQLHRFALLTAIQEKLDQKNLEEESKKLTKKLDAWGVGEELKNQIEDLLRSRGVPPRKSDTGRDGRSTRDDSINPRQVLERLYSRAVDKGFTFEDYPLITEYTRQLTLQDELEPISLSKEMNTLALKVREGLMQPVIALTPSRTAGVRTTLHFAGLQNGGVARSEGPKQSQSSETASALPGTLPRSDEKEVLSLLDDLFLLDNAVSLSLEKDTLDQFRSNMASLQPPVLLSRLKMLAEAVIARTTKARTKQSTSAEIASSSTIQALLRTRNDRNFLEAINTFYTGTEKRDEIIVKKALDLMKKEKKSKAVLITGGFHTGPIGDLLESNKASYMVITPRIKEIDVNRTNYYSTVMEDEIMSLRGPKDRSNLKDETASSIPGTFPRSDVSNIMPMVWLQAGLDRVINLSNGNPDYPATQYLNAFKDVATEQGLTVKQIRSINANNGSFIDPKRLQVKLIGRDSPDITTTGVSITYDGTKFAHVIELQPVKQVRVEEVLRAKTSRAGVTTELAATGFGQRANDSDSPEPLGPGLFADYFETPRTRTNETTPRGGNWSPLYLDQSFMGGNFLSNASAYGLKWTKLRFVQLQPGGEISPDPSDNAFPDIISDPKVAIAFSMVTAQSMAAALYSGIAKDDSSDQTAVGKLADANAVQVGFESLRMLAKAYGVRIVIIGNEGRTRDGSAIIELGTVFNPDGSILKPDGTVIKESGEIRKIDPKLIPELLDDGVPTFLYTGDSIEFTNGVKRGERGAWSMAALLSPLNQWSTDGYRITAAWNSKKPVEIDPVIKGSNTLRDALKKIAFKGNKLALRKYLVTHKLVTLGRGKHNELISQAEALKSEGFTWETISDGDPTPMILGALLGIPDKDGRVPIVFSTGGGNEHYMVKLAAQLLRDQGAQVASRHAATSALKAEDGYVSEWNFSDAHKGQGVPGLDGSLDKASEFSGIDITEFEEGNEIFRSHPFVRQIPLGDVRGGRIERSGSVVGRGVLVASAVTGARSVDAGIRTDLLNNVTFKVNRDGSGTVTVNAYIVTEHGAFITETIFETQNMLDTQLRLRSAVDESQVPADYTATHNLLRRHLKGQFTVADPRQAFLINPKVTDEDGREVDLVIREAGFGIALNGELPITMDYLRDHHAQIARFVEENVKMLNGARIDFADDSQEERLENEAVAAKEVYRVKEGRFKGNLYARSHSEDVARTADRTFVASSDENDKGIFNNWRETQTIKPRVLDVMKNSAAGKTIYVVPFIAGEIAGVQLTDSRYVALNLIKLYKNGRKALDAIGDRDNFIKAIHSTGNLDTLKRTGKDDDQRFYLNVVDDNLILSHGSAYGGNAILPKKFVALRQAMYRASKDRTWLAEHMMVLGIHNKKTGQTKYIAGAFPSASGKTNASMLQVPEEFEDEFTTFTVSDDIAHFKVGRDGKLRAKNAEEGGFLVVPGTNDEKNPMAMQAIGADTGTVFTNVAAKFDEYGNVIDLWWEDLSDAPPADIEGWFDWRGKAIKDRPDAEKNAKWAHPNSRATTRLKNVPNWIGNAGKIADPKLRPTDWDNPDGVEISAIEWGGRLQEREPLLRQIRGVAAGIYDGTGLKAERTAAAAGKVGEIRRDPKAQADFYSIPEWAHDQLWVDVLSQVKNPPAFFHINVFLQGWKGFRQNFRLYKWMLDRVDERVGAKETPVGDVPLYEDIDWRGLDMDRETFERLTHIDIAKWKLEMADFEQWWGRVKHLFPKEIVQAHEDQIARLGGYEDVIKPVRVDRVDALKDGLAIMESGYASYDPRDDRQPPPDQNQTPIVIGRSSKGNIRPEDVVVEVDFRNDRVIQSSGMILETNPQNGQPFNAVPLDPNMKPRYITMTHVVDSLKPEELFPPLSLEHTMDDEWNEMGLRVLKTAETEKRAHTTFFFHGQKHGQGASEEWQHPKSSGKNYAQNPGMEAEKVADIVIDSLEGHKHDVIVVNFANPDMVGHEGKFDAAVKAVEIVDHQLGRVIEAAKRNKTIMIITADHGNAEIMVDKDGQPHTSHTFSQTPLIIVFPDGNYKVVYRPLTDNFDNSDNPPSRLADIYPTMFDLYGWNIPKEVEGKSLIANRSEIPTFNIKENPIVLAVLDGWGYGEPDATINAIYAANTPVFDNLVNTLPWTRLYTHGKYVGLPDDIFGNSEIGHLNIGGGRAFKTDIVRINESISSGQFFENPTLLDAARYLRESGSALHLRGLLTEAGVHAHQNHWDALLKFADGQSIPEVWIHLKTDGRDGPATGGVKLIRQLQSRLDAINARGKTKIAIRSIDGRYYGMDRDGNYDRTALDYDAMFYGRHILDRQAEREMSAIDLIDSFREGDAAAESRLATFVTGGETEFVRIAAIRKLQSLKMADTAIFSLLETIATSSAYTRNEIKAAELALDSLRQYKGNEGRGFGVRLPALLLHNPVLASSPLITPEGVLPVPAFAARFITADMAVGAIGTAAGLGKLADAAYDQSTTRFLMELFGVTRSEADELSTNLINNLTPEVIRRAVAHQALVNGTPIKQHPVFLAIEGGTLSTDYVSLEHEFSRMAGDSAVNIFGPDDPKLMKIVSRYARPGDGKRGIAVIRTDKLDINLIHKCAARRGITPEHVGVIFSDEKTLPKGVLKGFSLAVKFNSRNYRKYKEASKLLLKDFLPALAMDRELQQVAFVLWDSVIQSTPGRYYQVMVEVLDRLYQARLAKQLTSAAA